MRRCALAGCGLQLALGRHSALATGSTPAPLHTSADCAQRSHAATASASPGARVLSPPMSTLGTTPRGSQLPRCGSATTTSIPATPCGTSHHAVDLDRRRRRAAGVVQRGRVPQGRRGWGGEGARATVPVGEMGWPWWPQPWRAPGRLVAWLANGGGDVRVEQL